MNNEFPRKGSALYGMINEDKEKNKRTLNNWKKFNKVFVFFYKIGLLPLLGVGWFILLLYNKGRKTGKTRVTPIEYRRRKGSLILFSARGQRSDWYRNLVANPEDVKIRMGFHTYEPVIELLTEPKIIEEYLRWYLKEHPRSSRFLFGWDLKRDSLETSDLTSLVNILKIVKLDVNYARIEKQNNR